MKHPPSKPTEPRRVLVLVDESNVTSSAKAANRKLDWLKLGGGRSAVRGREGNQLGRAVGADIRGSLSGIVNLEPPLNIGRDPGVEAAVRAPEHVNEPRFWERLRHAVKLYHPDNPGGRCACSVADP